MCWVFPQDAEQGFALFEREARAAFEFFSDRVGPFVYEKLAHVQAAGMGGGIENASKHRPRNPTASRSAWASHRRRAYRRACSELKSRAARPR
jgi:hypothetical protein